MTSHGAQRSKVVLIAGTRPEAIKMAPVLSALRSHNTITPLLLATGQHREMLERTLEVFGLKPDGNVAVMTENQSLDALTARLVDGAGAYLKRERPDLVLVQGDTTTALCGALAAFYHGIPVGHVGAGLRSGNKRHPFPEEMNRVLIGEIAALHFAPTWGARRNLLAARVPPRDIWVTGGTGIDAACRIWEEVAAREPRDARLAPLGAAGRLIVVATGQARESVALPEVHEALRELADRVRDAAHLVYPVPAAPGVRRALDAQLSSHPGITLLDPLDYRDFVWLLGRSYMVLTDSGSVQEESAALKKPVLVLGDATERPEAVSAGAARIAGGSADRIVGEAVALLENERRHRTMASAPNPFGDGHAAERVAAVVAETLSAARAAVAEPSLAAESV
jgi:UDP-N-acetylglucosamine 2-epimerase (non-hydrolysing)